MTGTSLALAAMILCSVAAAAAAPGPDLWLRLDGREPGAVVTGGHPVDGRAGGAIAFDGTGGLEVGDAAFTAETGCAVDFWVRFAEVGQNMVVCDVADEWFLRLDPPNEGNQLSLFVNAGGSLEPRIRGLAPRAGEWYHIIVNWDGLNASLWINGRRYQGSRGGGVRRSGQPLRFAHPEQWAPVGLKGALDEIKVYRRPLADREAIEAMFGLAGATSGTSRPEARFDFGRGDEGWQAAPGTAARRAEGRLQVTIAEPGDALLRRGLAVPIDGAPYLSLRLTAHDCRQIQVPFVTSAGGGVLEVPVIRDGQEHSYVVDATTEPAWSGELQALGLTSTDDGALLDLAFLRVGGEPEAPPEIDVRSLLPEPVIARAGRPVPIVAELRNSGGTGGGLTAELRAAGATIAGAAAQPLPALAHGETCRLRWTVEVAQPGDLALQLRIGGGETTAVTAGSTVPFAPALELPPADYVPEPNPPATDVLVGCHYCPLWKQGSRSGVWELIEPFPARKPALGFYDEDNPEVTDWEIKYALDHGISFFIYCWYRANQQAPVEQNLGHAIHDGLFQSRYGDKFRWCIMWENQSRGHAGVASEDDFLNTLLPYWIETYFKRPDYLKIDNKPLLYIYRPEYLVDDLGGIANVRSALAKAREIVKAAGFDGIWFLGEYRGQNREPLQLMVDEGLDAAFQYCWPVGGDPTPAEAIAAQEQAWRGWRDMDVIPYQITASMGWDSTPWHPSFSRWHLPPRDFQTLCERARAAAEAMPEGSLGRRIVLLDNWNEFGEGHYIAPHREYGFGYLDAVRAAFAPEAGPHADVVPEDIGRGPYETRYDAWKAAQEAGRRVVTAPGGEAPGLVGWWSFDEADGEPFAWDYTGHAAGGMLNDATRAAGRAGRALVCDGGSVTVAKSALAWPTGGLTVEAWIRTEVPEQTDRWFVNSIYGDGSGGFRFGISDGKLCFAVPLTPWSHHLSAPETLPTGRWIHVAGVSDGAWVKLYQNGELVATMPRIGRVRVASGPLTLGNFAVGHRAHFDGLLDDVKLWRRALGPEEIAEHAR